MSDFKKGLDRTIKKAGWLEYLFAILAVVSMLPVAATYFVFVKLIIQPIQWLFKKIWK